jgi:hypothetical protein
MATAPAWSRRLPTPNACVRISGTRRNRVPATVADMRSTRRAEMARFKVCYSGYAYVEADSEDEAEQNFWDDMESYKETSVDVIVEVDEFEVEV